MYDNPRPEMFPEQISENVNEVDGHFTQGERTPVDDLTKIATEINAEHEAAKDAFNSGFTHALRAGELLIKAKAAVKHGEWGPWLEKNCQSISQRTAQLYMRIVRERETLESNTQDLAHLTLERAVASLTRKNEKKTAEKISDTKKGEEEKIGDGDDSDSEPTQDGPYSPSEPLSEEDRVRDELVKKFAKWAEEADIEDLRRVVEEIVYFDIPATLQCSDMKDRDQ